MIKMIEDIWTTVVTVVIAAAIIIAAIVLYMIASLPFIGGSAGLDLSIQLIGLWNEPYNFASIITEYNTEETFLQNVLFSAVQNHVFSDKFTEQLKEYISYFEKSGSVILKKDETIFTVSREADRCGQYLQGYCTLKDFFQDCGAAREENRAYNNDCKKTEICCVYSKEKANKIPPEQQCGSSRGFCEKVHKKGPLAPTVQINLCPPGRTPLGYEGGWKYYKDKLSGTLSSDPECKSVEDNDFVGVCCVPEEESRLSEQKIIEYPVLYKDNQKADIIVAVR
jgi:hypothetical protein